MIKVQSLIYQYPTHTEPTLKNLSFDLKQGDIFGFLGPSGSGKSTTQKILFGLLKGYSGQVQILGQPVSDWGRDLYEKIGVSLEFPRFYGRLTARENLDYYQLFYPSKTGRSDELLKLLGLWKDRDRPVEQYSKGMKMRLNLIRALQHDPKILFLDEPTSGLDPIHASRVKELLKAEKEKGKVVFLTTHNMGLAQDLCDRVAFLVDGEIKSLANPDTLRFEHRSNQVWVEYLLQGETMKQVFPLDELGHNPDFLALIQGHEIERIQSLEPNLEQIFLATTGRALQ